MSTRTVDLNLYGEFIGELISAAVDAANALDELTDLDLPSGSHRIAAEAILAQMELEIILNQLNAIPVQRGQASREKLIEYVKTGGHSGTTNWYIDVKPEHLTDDQLRVIADGIACDMKSMQRRHRISRENYRQRSTS